MAKTELRLALERIHHFQLVISSDVDSDSSASTVQCLSDEVGAGRLCP